MPSATIVTDFTFKLKNRCISPRGVQLPIVAIAQMVLDEEFHFIRKIDLLHCLREIAVAKPTLTPDLHIVELNRRLRLHCAYRDGMAFVAYPEDAKGHAISGYSVLGPFGLMGVYAQVAHDVANDFDLIA